MDYTIDYYQILEVGKLASKEELKAAYRRLAKLHHPDKNPGDAQAAERFRAVQQAYEVLFNDISRHVYDEYRSIHQQSTKTSPEGNTNDLKVNKTSKSNTREFTQTRKVQREKRVYIKGRIQVKYQGVPEVVESYMAGKEQHYTVSPTETLVIIQSSGVYKDVTPKEYEKAFSSAELFAAPISQPIRCQVEEAGQTHYYNLLIHDLKIKDPHISNITHHEQDSFGELWGDCFGYVVHRYEEEVTEAFTEYFGATGEVETKQEAGVYFNRQQYYSKDGSKYWGEWSVHQSATKKARTYASRKTKTNSWTPKRRAMDESWKDHAWIIYLFIALLIWPKTMLILLVLFGVLWLTGYLCKSSVRLQQFIPVLAALLLVGLLSMGIFSLLHPGQSSRYKRRDDYQPLDTHKHPLPDNDKDTLISHLVQWVDYDSNRYAMQLSILQSAVNSSQRMHASMLMTNANANGIGAVYAQLEQMDTGKLQYVYCGFDSIIRNNHLNEMQAAKMMVSCIQSIPYYLIVDQSCGAHYNDAFIDNYLQHCENDCCLGNVKFGVQSPAEFIGNIKGDCDTRALVLFDILSKRGGDVALLTSAYYKHALIAVHFKNESLQTGISIPINGQNFYLWETTSAGHPLGVIPEAISSLQYWNVSLIHQQ